MTRKTIALAAALLATGAARAVRCDDAPSPGAPASDASAADPREPDVRKLIDRYFKSWSSQDIDRYGRCFHPQAAVQIVDAQGRVATLALGRFLKTQELAHKQAKHPLVETPETVEVRFEGSLARVVVKWKLVDGPQVTRGYDHFTLLETNSGWRVVNLVFYDEGTFAP